MDKQLSKISLVFTAIFDLNDSRGITNIEKIAMWLIMTGAK